MDFQGLKSLGTNLQLKNDLIEPTELSVWCIEPGNPTQTLLPSLETRFYAEIK